ncbi:MAG: hypothetical protein JXR85_07575 [Deltaproteobacteria bacterium]|nr:hypothetical protein [Deltaproteobacteria bacterium]
MIAFGAMMPHQLDSYNRKEYGLHGCLSRIAVPAILLTVVMLLFGDVLFASHPPVLSSKGMDLSSLFLHLRTFAFHELKQGNLALWNPYCFSGIPCLGGLQAAQLYPLNLIFMLPSIAHAVNWSIVIHVFLMGLNMYIWGRYRGIHVMAAFVAALCAMFGGSFFLHLIPGSLPNLCTMVWAPLVFLSIDGWFDHRSGRWVTLGVFAVAMQILAGHPQYLFYTGVAALLYSALQFTACKHRITAVIGMPLIYVGAVIVGAVQLFPGFEFAHESARSGGISYGFAASFSFPPENLITFLVPGIFGDLHNLPYWGRWFLWEMCPFFGITGFFLFLYGTIYGRRTVKRFSATMAVILMILALGGYTPLFRLLYEWLPGFDIFRGNSKFIFQASLFMAMLAGIGFDRLLDADDVSPYVKASVLAGAFAFALAGLFVYGDGLMGEGKHSVRMIMEGIYRSGESYLPGHLYAAPDFIRAASKAAVIAVSAASAVCIVLWLLLFGISKRRGVVWGIVVVLAGELIWFAAANRPTFPLEYARPPALEHFLAARSGDYRILDADSPNLGMSIGVSNLWGYDTPLKRYAEFMAFTQGSAIEGANEYTPITRYHPLYGMLRCQYVIAYRGNERVIGKPGNDMPRLVLVGRYAVVPDGNGILEELVKPDFDPYRTVILERRPVIQPYSGSVRGSVKIVDESTDYMVIEADTADASVLLITDPHSDGWRARALEGSVQKEYELMRANYTLRGIPLTAGRHRIMVEYKPWGYEIGRWVSVFGLSVWIVLWGWGIVRGYRSSKRERTGGFGGT